MDNKQYLEYLKTDKWKRISQKRMEIDKYTCQMCGCHGTMQNQLEIHHMSYKYLYCEEKRIYQDLICLCHCCHKSIHNVMNRVTAPDGRRGWKDNSYIPQVHVFNINGIDTDFKEVSKHE